ncbi:spore germination protein [Tumebacillus sp. BK434]|uniref:GerAB/ArcD/ProY family transporter n=1 Tax=Tumebacillus sp. BK434 TaxID=2512169 RepID=UPI0010D5ACF8|nr:endospore germination permease [Tumebacillus sp. BK434]TCP52831.1 spore germination protein [Tumebacillus sp. BK434]
MTQQAKGRPNGRRNRKKPYYIFTYSQSMSVIASTIIGVGVLTLPRSSTADAHQYGWVAVLIALLISIAAVLLIGKLCARFPGKTLVELCRELLGSKKHPWVGNVLSFPIILLYTAFWLIVTGLVARTFGEVVVTAVLVNTPLEVIVGTMLFLCFYFSFYDSEVVARVNEVLLVIVVVPVLFISVSAYQNAKFEYIMPLFPTMHLMGIAMAILPALDTFLGMEIMLMFNSNIKYDKKLLRYQVYGVLLPGIVYLLIVIAGTMSFGYEELSRQSWPTLELIKSVNVPGLILERLEAVFLGVWVAAVFTSAGNWFYCANWSIKKLFGIKKPLWSSLFCYVASYFIAMKVAQNIQELFYYLEMIGYIGIVVAGVLPLCLLLLSMVRKMDGRKAESGEKEASVHEAS